MTPMASAPVHQLRRVAARHRALPVAPSDTHQAAPRAGPDGRIAPDHAPRTLTVPACPLTTVANRDGLLPRLVLPSSDPVHHLLNRTRSRADTPGASRAAQSVVTSKRATSRLSRRGPAAAEPEGATRQVPAALPAGVARPPGLCARGGGRPTIRGGKGHVLMATASGAPATVTTASTLTPGALSRSKKLPGVTSVTARLTRARPLSGMLHP
jgi:hypothetical protein